MKDFVKLLSILLAGLFAAALEAQAAAIVADFSVPDSAAITAPSYTATGKAINFTLNFTPPTGTELMVVNNTGRDSIDGTFANLAQGDTVTLAYGGIAYRFVANYYGGTGNDLVLAWAERRVMGWGANGAGYLGDGTSTQRKVATAVVSSGVLAGKTILSVSTGGTHAVALCSDGTLVSWGDGSSTGVLGTGTYVSSSVPVLVNRAGDLAGRRVTSSGSGANHTLALCADSAISAWGYNSSGQLGEPGGEYPYNTGFARPILVNNWNSPGLTGKSVMAIASGSATSYALCTDGAIAAWGYNARGAMGNGTTGSTSLPSVVDVTPGVSVLAGKTVVAIAAGGEHGLALCSDGTLAAWGRNDYGQLGDNSTVNRLSPVAVNADPGLSELSGRTVVKIAAGYDQSYALCSDGSIVAWGRDHLGQLGFGASSASPRLLPVLVNAAPGSALNGRSVVSIAAGKYHALALCSDGTAVSWGSNSSGQLGDNTITSHPLATVVSTSSLAAGERFISLVSGTYSDFTMSLVAAPAPVPSVSTSLLAVPAATSVTLKALVSTNGAASDVFFQYSTDPALATDVTTTPTQVVPFNAVGATVNTSLTGLSPHTKYYVRARSTNSVGTTDSAISFFTTANTAPTAPNQTVGGTTGDQRTVTINFPAQDVDGDPVTLTSAASGSNITVNGRTATTVTFTHTGKTLANGTFTYTVSDGNGLTATGTVTVIVADNDEPDTTITASPPALTNATTARFVFTGLDNIALARFEASLDDGPFASAVSALNLSGVAEGSHTVRVRAIDSSGNVDSTPATAEWVVDRTPPAITFISGNITIEAAGPTGTVVDYPAAIASDAVTVAPTITYSKPSGDLFPVGSTTVLVTASDGAGNQRSDSFTVNVHDTTRPGVAAHANLTVEATSAAGAMVDYAPGSATDALTGAPVITYSQERGSLFPLGLTTVIIYATDEAGNTGTNSFTVTVVDTTKPVVAPHARVLAEATSTAGATVVFAPGTAADAVTSAPAITYSRPSGSVFPIGDTVVRIMATDAAGNTGLGSFTVSVTGEKVDRKAPAVAFTAPASGKVTGAFTLAGTVQENIALRSLKLTRNGEPVAFDPLPAFAPDLKQQWSTSIAPENGTETFVIEAVDFAGHVTTATKTITFTKTRPELAGTYTALLVPTGPPTLATTALVSVTVTASGSFSGKYSLSGTTWPFTGVLLNDNTARFTPTQAAQLNLSDKVNGYVGALGFAVSEAGGLTGTLAIESGGSVLANISAARTLRGTSPVDPALLNFPAAPAPPMKGIYSVVFPAGTTTSPVDPATWPQGNGYASLTLMKSGSVLLAGYLADGTRYTAAGVMRADSTVPLFNPSYGKRGVFAGTLAFADLPDSDLTGADFVWFRPAATTGNTFRAGWPAGVRISAVGAKHTAPAAFDFGQGIPDIVRGNADLVFSRTMASPVSLDPAKGTVKLITTSATPASVALSPANGLFAGAVRHGGVTDKFGGILLHKGVNRGGFGYFLTTPQVVGAGLQSSSVALRPRVEE